MTDTISNAALKHLVCLMTKSPLIEVLQPHDRSVLLSRKLITRNGAIADKGRILVELIAAQAGISGGEKREKNREKIKASVVVLRTNNTPQNLGEAT